MTSPLQISGVVYDASGQARPDATIELWHADHHGHYDIEGYHFRSILPIDAKGAYQVDTVMPGHYPDVPEGGAIWVFAVK